MGRVELVVRREGEFARVYAMKRLLGELVDDDELREMFIQEARIAGLIRHANVVPVLDVGEDDIGPFLVMEYVEGVPAWKPIVRARDVGDRMPVGLCVEIVRQAALGLSAAHELIGPGGRALGVVHRDVSPHNVLIGFDGIVRVTDFGVARALDHGSRTRVGMLKGKTGYMAPEQIAYEKLDARADLFGLGVVAYELLAGRRLYPGAPEDAFERIRNEPPPDVREVRPEAPPEIAELVKSLLAKSRDDRPASAAEVASRLERIARALDEPADAAALAAYLDTTFADERARLRALAVAALERTDVEVSSPGISERPPGGEGEITRTLRTSGPQRLRRALIIGLGLTAIAIAGAVWLGSARQDDEPRAAVTPEAPAIDPAPSEPPVEPRDEAAAVRAMPEDEPDPVATTPAEVAERRDRPRRHSRRRPRSREPATTDSSPAVGEPLSKRAWGWDEGAAQ